MFKRLTDDAKLPQRSTKYSAGFDVFANEDVVIGAGETRLVGLGICLDDDEEREMLRKAGMPTLELWGHYYLELHIRSSLRVKGLTPLGTGIIDIDYPDEIKMVVHNPITEPLMWEGVDGKIEYTINKGDKIGQLILKRHEGYLIPQEYTLDAERSGGLGVLGNENHTKRPNTKTPRMEPISRCVDRPTRHYLRTQR